MKISVNLASRPFVELRPVLAKLRLTMVALAVLAIGLAFGLHALTVKERAASARMDALKAQTAAVQNQLSANEARMRQPQNRAVLERAQFLNTLFTEKSFSWTAVMMDLENVLPAGVQVTAIEPQITKEGDVNIRLRVTGDRERAVELVENLERSKRFLAPRLMSESLQANQGTAAQLQSVPGAVEFDILSGYNPLPVLPKHAHATDAAADKSAAANPAMRPTGKSGGAR